MGTAFVSALGHGARVRRRRGAGCVVCALPRADVAAGVALERSATVADVVSVLRERGGELQAGQLAVALWRVSKQLRSSPAATGGEPLDAVAEVARRLAHHRAVPIDAVVLAMRALAAMHATGDLTPLDAPHVRHLIATCDAHLPPPSTIPPGHLTSLTWSWHVLQPYQPPTAVSLPHLAHSTRRAFPFRIEHAALLPAPFPSPADWVAALRAEVRWHRDLVTVGSRGSTGARKTVPESRLTAWQAASPGLCFAYSGKTMRPAPFSPLVRQIRRRVEQKFDLQFDGVLINLYPDGKSGMRFHSDPDQGVLWAEETAVVSLGSARQFVFRKVGDFQERHEFLLQSGDVVWMYGDCQERYQHAVKVEARRGDAGPRISLVFKKALPATLQDR